MNQYLNLGLCWNYDHRMIMRQFFIFQKFSTLNINVIVGILLGELEMTPWVELLPDTSSLCPQFPPATQKPADRGNTS